MVELVLNGIVIILPDKFTDTFVEENSLLTKNGEYTMDMEISLMIPTNAQFFKHINRFNISKYKTITSAILIVDNFIRFNGVGDVISINNESVKIQLLSGNSELNYISDDKLMLSDIDFGTAAGSINLAMAVAVNTGTGNYTFACARNYIAGTIYNGIYGYFNDETQVVDWHEGGQILYNVQPYVMYYFVCIMQHLEYTITENVLENDEFFKRLIIFSGNNSLNFNDLIPDWTVVKFINEIEKLANVGIVINKLDKSIRILNNYTHYSTAAKHYVPENDIMDMYEVETVENEYAALNYKNVKYNLDGTDYFKYQCLTEEVLKTATIETYATYDAMLGAYLTNELRIAALNTLRIFKVTQSGNYYMIRDYGSSQYWFRRINMFKEQQLDSASDTFVEFNIVPVEIKDVYVANVDEALVNGSPVTDINNLIVNGTSTNVKSNILRCGFQLGLQPLSLLNNPSDTYFNIATNDCYELVSLLDQELLIDSHLTFRFDGVYGLNSRYYSHTLNIDNTRKWTINFKWKPEYDVRNYFIFLGKKFICEKIETEGDNENNGGFVTGYFYGSGNIIN